METPPGIRGANKEKPMGCNSSVERKCLLVFSRTMSANRPNRCRFTCSYQKISSLIISFNIIATFIPPVADYIYACHSSEFPTFSFTATYLHIKKTRKSHHSILITGSLEQNAFPSLGTSLMVVRKLCCFLKIQQKELGTLEMQFTF